LLIFLKYNTKHAWQILDEKVPIVRLCGQPARSQAHPATTRGTARSEVHTNAETRVLQLLQIYLRFKDLFAHIPFPKAR